MAFVLLPKKVITEIIQLTEDINAVHLQEACDDSNTVSIHHFVFRTDSHTNDSLHSYNPSTR